MHAFAAGRPNDTEDTARLRILLVLGDTLAKKLGRMQMRIDGVLSKNVCALTRHARLITWFYMYQCLSCIWGWMPVVGT